MVRMGALVICLVMPAATWAQGHGAADLDLPNLPIRSQAVLSGAMFTNETEFLTPEGILDTLPPQQALIPVESIEPAAGPDVSSTEPVSPSQPPISTEVPAL